MQKSPEANKAITKFKLPVSITQPNRRSTKRVINPPGNIIIPFQSVVVSPVEILIGSYVWSQFSRLPPPLLLLSPSHWSSSSSLQLVVCCCCCCFTSSMCSSPRQQQLQRKHKTEELLLLAPTTAGGEIVSAVHIILVARHIIPLSQYASASIPLSVGRRSSHYYGILPVRRRLHYSTRIPDPHLCGSSCAPHFIFLYKFTTFHLRQPVNDDHWC